MAARGSCPGCGSTALVEDAHYAQQQLVCAACGCVLSEGLLTTTYAEEEHLRGAAGPGPGGALPRRGHRHGWARGERPGAFGFGLVQNCVWKACSERSESV